MICLDTSQKESWMIAKCSKLGGIDRHVERNPLPGRVMAANSAVQGISTERMAKISSKASKRIREQQKHSSDSRYEGALPVLVT